MDSDARIQIDVPLGTPFVEIENSIIRQAIVLCEGNKHRAARRLDLGIGKVNRALKKIGRLANSQTHPHDVQGVGPRTGAGAGVDVSSPPPLGGQQESK